MTSGKTGPHYGFLEQTVMIQRGHILLVMVYICLVFLHYVWQREREAANYSKTIKNYLDYLENTHRQ